MLVLSRKVGEAIAFPALDITVRIAQVNGKCISLGIDAPKDVRVLRQELVPHLEKTCKATLGNVPHELRNKLNTIGLALHVLLQQMERQLGADEALVQSALDAFHSINALLTEKSTRPKKVLLVEDNQNESSLLAALLRQAGIDVATMRSGEAAIDYLRSESQTPSVVLLDMKMPGMGGAKTLEIIRKNKRFRDLRVFGVSGTSAEDAGVTVGARGANRWFMKPVAPDKLLESINRDIAA